MGALALVVITIVAAPPSFAAPSLEVSATDGLSDGQTITISGAGFAANLSQIAAGQCVDGYSGPSDCNLQGGATFRNADASGSIGTFDIVVKEKFGAFDCTVDKCVIAAAPLPTTEDAATISANQVIIPITFGAPTEVQPTEDPSADPAADPAAPGDGELPDTGAGDLLPIIVLGSGGFLLAGFGLRVLTRRPGGLA